MLTLHGFYDKSSMFRICNLYLHRSEFALMTTTFFKFATPSNLDNTIYIMCISMDSSRHKRLYLRYVSMKMEGSTVVLWKLQRATPQASFRSLAIGRLDWNRPSSVQMLRQIPQWIEYFIYHIILYFEIFMLNHW